MRGCWMQTGGDHVGVGSGDPCAADGTRFSAKGGKPFHPPVSGYIWAVRGGGARAWAGGLGLASRAAAWAWANHGCWAVRMRQGSPLTACERRTAPPVSQRAERSGTRLARPYGGVAGGGRV